MSIEALRRQAALQDVLLTRTAEQSLMDYVRQAWPILEPDQPFLPNWHLDLVAEHLEAVTAGECTRLLITLPPRYMKSLLVSVFWPTWEWLQRPGGRWIFASYAESLAEKHSVDRRAVLQSPWYQGRWGDRVCLALLVQPHHRQTELIRMRNAFGHRPPPDGSILRLRLVS